MAYSEKLADRIREALAEVRKVEEKQMMGGLTFMVNGKMCVGIFKDQLMCRIDPETHDKEVEKPGCRTMDFTNRPMRGFVLVDDTGMRTPKAFRYWIDISLAYNKQAKASKKKSPASQKSKNTAKPKAGKKK
jgi:TfoX/Sxy family transcriptional regulator of competence genes